MLGKTGAHNNFLISIHNKQIERREKWKIMKQRALINLSIKSNQGIPQSNDTFSSFLIPKISGGKQNQ